MPKVEAKTIFFSNLTLCPHYGCKVVYFFICVSFIRLWDHLASNLELYVQPQDSFMNEPPETKPTSGDQSGENDSHHSNPEAEKEKPNNLSRSRHNREWKGLVRDAVEPPPLRSSDIEKIHLEEKSSHKVGRAKRSTSPRPSIRRKRGRPDEHENKVGVPNFYL